MNPAEPDSLEFTEQIINGIRKNYCHFECEGGVVFNLTNKLIIWTKIRGFLLLSGRFLPALGTEEGNTAYFCHVNQCKIMRFQQSDYILPGHEFIGF